MKRAFLVGFVLIATSCSKGPGGNPLTAPNTQPGMIASASHPASASVRLDAGQPFYSPHFYTQVPVGSHQLAYSLLGYADTTVSVVVVATVITGDTVQLRPLAGTPRSISPFAVGLYEWPGPLAIGPGGRFYLTVHRPGSDDRVVVLDSTGALLHEDVIGDLAASCGVSVGCSQVKTVQPGSF